MVNTVEVQNEGGDIREIKKTFETMGPINLDI